MNWWPHRPPRVSLGGRHMSGGSPEIALDEGNFDLPRGWQRLVTICPGVPPRAHPREVLTDDSSCPTSTAAFDAAAGLDATAAARATGRDVAGGAARPAGTAHGDRRRDSRGIRHGLRAVAVRRPLARQVGGAAQAAGP